MERLSRERRPLPRREEEPSGEYPALEELLKRDRREFLGEQLRPILEKLAIESHPLYRLNETPSAAKPETKPAPGTEDAEIESELQKQDLDLRQELLKKKTKLRKDLENLNASAASSLDGTLGGSDQKRKFEDELSTFLQELNDFEEACLFQGLETDEFLTYRMNLARKEMDELTDPTRATTDEKRAEQERFRKYVGEMQEQLGIKSSLEEFLAEFTKIAEPIPEHVPAHLTGEQKETYLKIRRQQTHLQFHLINNVLLETAETAHQRDQFSQLLGKDNELEQQAQNRLNETTQKTIDQLKTYRYLQQFTEKIAEDPKKYSEQESALWKNLSLVLGLTVENVQEIFEEKLEDLCSFKRPAPVVLLPVPEAVIGMDRLSRGKLLSGYEGAKRLLGNKMPGLAHLMHDIGQSRFGTEMVKQMLTFQSPITVVMMLAYMRSSTDKLKAWAMFASMSATSSVSNALLEGAAAPLMEKAMKNFLGKELRSMAKTATDPKTAQRLRRLAKLFRRMSQAPKHWVVQLVVAGGVIMGTHEYLEKIWDEIDKRWDYRDDKQSAENIAAFLAQGDPTWFLTDLPTEFVNWGPWAVDPDSDAVGYLSQEHLPVEYYVKGIAAADTYNTLASWITFGLAPTIPTGDYGTLNHTLPDWNDRVQELINREPNPVRRELWKLEMADYTQWLNRQAFSLWFRTKICRTQEMQLAGELASREVEGAKSLNLLLLAVLDTGERNDNAIRRAEVDMAENARVVQYCNGLEGSNDPKDKELYALWLRYRSEVKEIAFLVQFFRRLPNVNYARADWIGQVAVDPNTRMPRKAEQGMVDDINYYLARREVLNIRGKDRAVRAEFVKSLAEFRKESGGTAWLDENILDKLGEIWFGHTERSLDREYERALIAACVDAATYLPDDHDFNSLFRELRDAKLSNQPLSRERLKQMRDYIMDEIVRHHERKIGEKKSRLRTFQEVRAEKTKSFERLTEDLAQRGLSLNPETTFFDGEFPPPAPVSGELYEITLTRFEGFVFGIAPRIFETDLRALQQEDKADIVLFQAVVYKGSTSILSGSVAFRLHVIECAGPEPTNWRVHVFRYHEGLADAAYTTPLEQEIDRGRAEVIPYLKWASDHYDLRHEENMDKALAEQSTLRREQAQGMQTAIKSALEEAAQTSNRFVAIPGRAEYRRVTSTGETVTLVRAPTARTINESRYRRSAPSDLVKVAVPDYVFLVRGTGGLLPYSIPAESIEEYDTKSASQQQLIRDVITTPIPGEIGKSLAGVLNIFKQATKVSDFPGTSQGNKEFLKSLNQVFGIPINVDTRFYYYDLLRDLAPIYARAANQKFFLEHLFDKLKEKGGVINEETAQSISQWFSSDHNQALFTQATPEQVADFTAGEKVLTSSDYKLSANQSGAYRHTASDGSVIDLFYNVNENPPGWVYKVGRNPPRSITPREIRSAGNVVSHRPVLETLNQTVSEGRERRAEETRDKNLKPFLATLAPSQRLKFNQERQQLGSAWKFNSAAEHFDRNFGNEREPLQCSLRFDNERGWLWKVEGAGISSKPGTSESDNGWHPIKVSTADALIVSSNKPSTSLYLELLNDALSSLRILFEENKSKPSTPTPRLKNLEQEWEKGLDKPKRI